MYTEEELSKIFGRDRKDFYKSQHLEECASDDENDTADKKEKDGNIDPVISLVLTHRLKKNPLSVKIFSYIVSRIPLFSLQRRQIQSSM